MCVRVCSPVTDVQIEYYLDGGGEPEHTVHEPDLSWLPAEFSFVPGQRGNPKLVHRGYSFTKNKTVNGKSYWSCAQVKTHKCRARIVIGHTPDEIKFTQTSHTHVP